MSLLHLPATTDILLLYPGQSLLDQVDLWAAQHPERQLEVSRERSLPEIRDLLRHSGAAVADATEDPAQATDAFLQAVTRLGRSAVAMYTEVMHDDLELFVRMQGSLFLLGPLYEEQWEELFERLMRVHVVVPRLPASTPQRLVAGSAKRGVRRQPPFINRLGAAMDWPRGDVN
jgi:hypothetical protein